MVCRRASLKTQDVKPWSSRRVASLAYVARKQRLQFTQSLQNWTTDDWKNIGWSDEWFRLLLVGVFSWPTTAYLTFWPSLCDHRPSDGCFQIIICTRFLEIMLELLYLIFFQSIIQMGYIFHLLGTAFCRGLIHICCSSVPQESRDWTKLP